MSGLRSRQTEEPRSNKAWERRHPACIFETRKGWMPVLPGHRAGKGACAPRRLVELFASINYLDGPYS